MFNFSWSKYGPPFQIVDNPQRQVFDEYLEFRLSASSTILYSNLCAFLRSVLKLLAHSAFKALFKKLIFVSVTPFEYKRDSGEISNIASES